MPDPGGAAFYGPKISVQARDAIGRTWQMSTIQYDFNQPARFELEYQAADGTRQQPVMIHSAKFGSIERFIGVLTEHYAGAFPAWLSPVQVDRHPGHRRAGRLPATTSPRGCGDAGIRVEVDASDDRMQKKIRTAQKQKVPFMLIAGATDAEAGAVSFRYRDGSQRNGIPVEQAVDEIADIDRAPGQRVADRGAVCADDATEEPADGFAGDAGRVRPAVDAAPDGLHQGRGQAGARRRGGRLPVLRGARTARTRTA